jgi:hypothetical protein
MSHRLIATYLNDHLAGSEGALELLQHLGNDQPASSVSRFATELRASIQAARLELEALMAKLQIAQSRPKKMAAWIAEKMTELKLRLDDTADGPLRRLEILEAVSVGIAGQRLLWQALAAAAEENPALQGVDYQSLDQRAEECRRNLETHRLEAAKMALKSE